MAANDNIPKDTEKTLFAEDLVCYVMSLHTYTENLPRTAEPYRDRVYNGFNTTTRIAVLFLYTARLKMNEDDEFLAKNLTYTRLISREKEIRQIYFPDGFEAKNFLVYCVHLTTLAACCYEKGVHEAPYLAVKCIVAAFEDFDMTTGGWDTLNGIAETYASKV